MKKILVLLSAYNGEKYLRTQIESVLNQKNVYVHLYIRDDGSQDSTFDIISSYDKSRVTCFQEKNRGARDSFLELLRMAPLDYDFYAFCDQDDFWEEDKLYCAISKLEILKEDEPSLYYSGQKLTNKNLQNITYHNIDIKRSIGANFIFNQAAGCTMVFNRALLIELKKYFPVNIFGHDVWCFKVCAALGGNIVIESEGHLLYRQHENNIVGINNSLLGKMKRAKKYYCFYTNSNYAKQILDVYGDKISHQWKDFLESIYEASKGNYGAKKKLLKSDLIKFNSIPLRCIFVLKVLMGKI